MSAKEQAKLFGASTDKVRSLQSVSGVDKKVHPAFAGQRPTDIVVDGVNVLSGDFKTTAIDLSFGGGFGVHGLVGRSYSANDPDEGPFGVGWTLITDEASLAHGVKGQDEPSLESIPYTIEERNRYEILDDSQGGPDPHTALDEAIVQVDCTSQRKYIYKDVDGRMSLPDDDHVDVIPTYEIYTDTNNSTWTLTKAMTVKTIDGTTYNYQKEGWYPNGIKPYEYDGPGVSSAPSNILQLTSITDRHNQTTNFVYSAAPVQFQRERGVANQNELLHIDMPDGRSIQFHWNANNRIDQVSDGERTVLYSYDAAKQLISVTSPALKVTQYGYGSAYSDPNLYNGPVADNLLTSITSPRGLTTRLHYGMGVGELMEGNTSHAAPFCYQVDLPNGEKTNVIHELQQGHWISIDTAVYPDGQPDDDVEGVCVQQCDRRIVVSHDGPLEIRAIQMDEGGGGLGSPLWVKHYDGRGNLKDETTYNYEAALADTISSNFRRFDRDYENQTVLTRFKYNILGMPLSKDVTETQTGSSLNSSQEFITSFAYWNRSKYCQLKAVKDPAGRYAYVDYYDMGQPVDNRGNVFQLYDERHGGWSIPGDWRTTIAPDSSAVPNLCSETRTYTKGRLLHVEKLRGSSTSHTYVATDYTYDNSVDPHGNVTSVSEQTGVPNGIFDRTTQFSQYTMSGMPTRITNAVGTTYVKSYDLDNRLLSIGIASDPQPLQTFAYGFTGIGNGELSQIYDRQSNTTETISYVPVGAAGVGQMASYLVNQGGDQYLITYQYNEHGDRFKAIYTSTDGLPTECDYTNYITVGEFPGGRSVPRVVKYFNSNTLDPSDEFHYQYDERGRVVEAAFAQTPQTGQTNYTIQFPAQTRARTHYSYDPGGRVKGVDSVWETWSPTYLQYLDSPLISKQYIYDMPNDMLGGGMTARLNSEVTEVLDPTTGSLGTPHRESYGYEHASNYLNQVDHNGDQTKLTQWMYDFGGNRISETINNVTSVYTYDLTNALWAAPGYSYQNDILGNRTLKTNTGTGEVTTYAWDVFNRLAEVTSSLGTQINYLYRADGMRVMKSSGDTLTRYRLDGTQTFEDSVVTPQGTTLTQYAHGARGLDEIVRDGTAYYPLSNGRGDLVATVQKTGPSSLSDAQLYEPWGSALSTGTAGPDHGFSGGWGHRTDEDTDLIYMNARYYDPEVGRFISEDPARDGWNYFAYCGNNPVESIDADGKCALLVVAVVCGVIGFVGGAIKAQLTGGDWLKDGLIGAGIGIALGLTCGLAGIGGAGALCAGEELSLAAVGEFTLEELTMEPLKMAGEAALESILEQKESVLPFAYGGGLNPARATCGG